MFFRDLVRKRESGRRLSALTWEPSIRYKIGNNYDTRVEFIALDDNRPGDRKLVGKIDVFKERGTDNWHVREIEVHPDYQRKGIGTGLYERAAQIARGDFGARRFCSDEIRSEFSQGFWEKQQRKGRAVFRGADYCIDLTKQPGRIDLSASPKRRRKKRSSR